MTEIETQTENAAELFGASEQSGKSECPATPSFAVPAPDSQMWAEMLARIADKNCRMNALVSRARRWRGARLQQELERERSRIARELHAGAGQPLAGIRINLDILASSTDSLPPEGQEAVKRLQRLADSALAEVRAVSHRLHPPEWQGLTTERAIEDLLRDFGAETYFRETAFDIRPLPVEPDYAARMALYRCAQECVSNVIRHAAATRLELSLIPDGDAVLLRVADNGRGIPEKTLAPSGSGKRGLGLNALREHAESAGGTCRINSGLSGTEITVRIPLEGE